MLNLFESAYKFVSSGGFLGAYLKEWEDSVLAQRVIGGLCIVITITFLIVCLVGIGYFNLGR